MTPTHEKIAALAPTPEPLDPAWATPTLARILEDGPATRRTAPWWRRTRRRSVALVASGVVVLTAGAAFAVGGPAQSVKDALLDFSRQPNTSGNGIGAIHDPELVAKFRTPRGVFAVWIATSSSGTLCSADVSGWDGEGDLPRDTLEYGCDYMLVDGSGNAVEFTRPDQLGGFLSDEGTPIVYGISPYPTTTQVHVQGAGVDRVLPVRADSLGFGEAFPDADGSGSVTLTYLDASGAVLGTRVEAGIAGTG